MLLSSAIGGRKKCIHLATAIARQMQGFKEEGVAALEQETVSQRGPGKRDPLLPDAAAVKRETAKLHEGDVKGAIRLLCSTDSRGGLPCHAPAVSP